MSSVSKLSAVNAVISNIGQAPVNSLESGNPMVELAEQIVDNISHVVQSEGWSFNTEDHYPFEPDNNGQILIPSNVLSIDTEPSAEETVVVRNGKLYDKYNHTYTFEGTQALSVVWLFDFEDLPEVFKNYITVRAANVFAGRALGQDGSARYGEREEVLARASCMEYECNQGDHNFFRDSSGRNLYLGVSYRPYGAVRRY